MQPKGEGTLAPPLPLLDPPLVSHLKDSELVMQEGDLQYDQLLMGCLSSDFSVRP